MKRNNLYVIIGIAVVVIVVVLCFFCCRGKKDVYCTAIPKNAITLVRVDAKSFLKDYDIDLEPVKSLMGKDAAEAVEDCGIDFRQPIYAFVLPSDKVGICAKIDDANALKQVVEKFGTSMNVKLSEKQGYTWLEQNGTVAAFDNDRLVAVMDGGMNVRKNILDMMEQREDESVLSTSMFDLISHCDKPLAVVASLVAIPSTQRVEIAKLLDIDVKDLDADVLLTLDFVKNKALLNFDVIPNTDEMKELIEDAVDYKKKISGKFLTTGIANPFALMVYGMDGEDLYEKLIEESGLGMFFGNLDLRKPVSSLEGDVCIQVATPDFNDILLQTEVKDNSIMDIIEPAVRKFGSGYLNVMKVADNQYCISNGRTPIFLGVKQGKVFYVGSSTDVTEKAGLEVDSHIEALRSEAVGNYFYATLDASALSGMLKRQMGIPALLMGRLSQFDRLTLKVTSATHAELMLSVKDGKDFVKTVFK